MFDTARTIACFVSSIILPRLARTVCTPLSAFDSLFSLSVIFCLVVNAYVIACLFTRKTLGPISFCLVLARSTLYTVIVFGKIFYHSIPIAVKVARLAFPFFLTLLSFAYTFVVTPICLASNLAFAFTIAFALLAFAALKFTWTWLSIVATLTWTCSISTFGFARRTSSYAVSLLRRLLNSELCALMKVLAVYIGLIVMAKLAWVGRWMVMGRKREDSEDMAGATAHGTTAVPEPHPVAPSVSATLSSTSSDSTLCNIHSAFTSTYHRFQKFVLPAKSETLLLSPASSIASLDTDYCDSEYGFDDYNITLVDCDVSDFDEKLPLSSTPIVATTPIIPATLFSPRFVLPDPLAGALVPASPNVDSDLGAQKAQAPLLPPFSLEDDTHTLGEGKRKKTRRGGRKVPGWERRARQRARREDGEPSLEFLLDIEDASA